MKRWSLSWSRDGWAVALEDVPAWAVAAERAAFAADWVFRHRLCNPPGWLWRVPVWPGRDGDLWEHSLGGLVWRGWQRWASATNGRGRRWTVPVSREMAAEVQPEWVSEWDSEEKP